MALLLCGVVGCNRPSPHVSNPSPSPVAPAPIDAAPIDAAPIDAAPSTTILSGDLPAPRCAGRDERMYGTTCCESYWSEDMIPGMVYLSCSGPQIGQPCRAKGDCDVVCSCDPEGAHLGAGTDAQGPADGTRGAVGRCGGRLQIGTLMCQIDEHGTVGHLIVN